MPAISDPPRLLQGLDPLLNPGAYVFVSVSSLDDLDVGNVIALMQEPEGLSAVLEEAQARKAGFVPDSTFAWITLSVKSDLEAVGLTAAFASALCGAGIGCNAVTDRNHDHIFVPVGSANAALARPRRAHPTAARTLFNQAARGRRLTA